MSPHKIIRSRSENETTKDFMERMVDLLTSINAMYEGTTWTVVYMYSSPTEVSDAIFTEHGRKVAK